MQAEIFAALMSGTCAVLRRDGDHLRLWFGAAGAVWWLEGGRHLGLLLPIQGAAELPPAITTWWATDRVSDTAPEVVRARDLVAAQRQTRAALGEGMWFWTDDTTALTCWPSLGSLRLGMAEEALRWLAPEAHPEWLIAQALWSGVGPGLRAATVAAQAALATVAQETVVLRDAVQQGAAMLLAPPRAIVYLDGRWLSLTLTDALRLDVAALLNPWALVIEEDAVLKQILSQHGRSYRPWRRASLSDGLREDLRGLTAGPFQWSREEIVQRYLAHLQGGGSISGGPTTDQSWTVFRAGDGYTLLSYAPGENGYPERVSEPLSEARVRDMIGGYRMFGLYRLPTV